MIELAWSDKMIIFNCGYLNGNFSYSMTNVCNTHGDYMITVNTESLTGKYISCEFLYIIMLLGDKVRFLLSFLSCHSYLSGYYLSSTFSFFISSETYHLNWKFIYIRDVLDYYY